MAWEEGYDLLEPITDWNKKFKEELKEELDDGTARRTLGKFIIHNPAFAVELLTGYRLEPFQRLILKGWFRRNFSLCVAGRGGSKSTLAAHFAYLYALMNPGHRVLCVSANFRSSRSILENIDRWSKARDTDLDGLRLRQLFLNEKMMRRNDVFQIEFVNHALITAVPLGDSNNLRGYRCNVLIVDEGLLIPEHVIEKVLKPFLVANADIREKQKIIARENRLIETGNMTEDQRTVFDSNSKMIILSSASYTWEYLYKLYQKYLSIIYDYRDGRNKDRKATYLVQQYSYEIVPKYMLDAGMLQDLESGNIPQHIVDSEYKAKFVQGSSGFFSAEKMNKCCVPEKMEPCLELVGTPGAEYVLGIDPNVGNSKADDHFAMCLMKIITKESGKKIGMVVHSYACAGVDLKHHLYYFAYLLQKFNIVYIIWDATQGEGLGFLAIAGESEIFKQRKLELKAIKADFAIQDTKEIIKQIRRGYNREEGRIVHPQTFTGSMKRAANEYLQACINFQNIQFGGNPQTVQRVMDRFAHVNLNDPVLNKPIYNLHPQFQDENMEGSSSLYDFVAWQDALIKLVIQETCSIEMRSTPAGHVEFDLPPSMSKRSKDERRPRKDSYTALFLCCWGVRLYLESQEGPVEEPVTNYFRPRLI